MESRGKGPFDQEAASELSFFLMTQDFATAPGTSTFPFILPPWGPGPWLTGPPAKTLLGPFLEKFPVLSTPLSPRWPWAHSLVSLKGWEIGLGGGCT